MAVVDIPNLAAAAALQGADLFVLTQGGLLVPVKGTLTDLRAFAIATLGSAALKNTGASGDAVPLLNAAHIWALSQTFNADLIRDGAAATNRSIKFRTGGLDRWILVGANNTAEGGANAGANLALNRCDDAGIIIDSPIFVNRATGVVLIGSLALSAALAISSGGHGATTAAAGLANLGGAPAASPSFTGLITVGGGQLAFPVVQSASADANTLDDYEEGIFTPRIDGTTVVGAGTYSVQAGRYQKIGNRVFFQLRVVWSAHTGTGNMIIEGLPFNASAAQGGSSAVALDWASLTFVSRPTGRVELNSTKIVLYDTPSNTALTSLVMDTAATIVASGSYEV